ncbi:MAG TPA: SRPBCC family protein [Mucilaginibacter sp.]|jgi:carbon monoxide dehydrogenase subunit G|nr:SRPBCC family protein [Mucilaginibacter sp.]
MTTFESKITIDRAVSDVYNFLADLNNHQQLMPENIYNWASTHDAAQFTIQNMGKLGVKVSNRVENKEIVIIPAEQAPFDLEMKWELSSAADGTHIQYTVSADLNIMMKMLASGPLQKLADHQTQSLGAVFS